MKYDMMIPDFERVDFDKMNKKQAEEYFEWYVNQIDNRISVLSKAVKEDGGDMEFDYSVESLIPLWKWYETKISYRKLSDSEYHNIISKYPQWMIDHINDNDLSWETLMICMDVAIYFAEVIVKHNSSIKWGYFTKPKKRASVNQPVLLGFKYDKDLNPRLIVENCTRHSGEEKKSTRLYDMYFIWMGFI